MGKVLRYLQQIHFCHFQIYFQFQIFFLSAFLSTLIFILFLLLISLYLVYSEFGAWITNNKLNFVLFCMWQYIVVIDIVKVLESQIKKQTIALYTIAKRILYICREYSKQKYIFYMFVCCLHLYVTCQVLSMETTTAMVIVIVIAIVKL